MTSLIFRSFPVFSNFLMIENRAKQIPSIELMRMLGASSSRGQERKIGQFGSGFPNLLALFARKGILEDSKFCLGDDVYECFLKKHDLINDSGNSISQYEIMMRKQGGGTVNLNISTGFGELDWTDVTMGVRELISNACDGAESYDGTYSTVVLDPNIPNENNQTRRKAGYIRIYIPLTWEIKEYIENIGNTFLCLRKGYDPARTVFPNNSAGPARVYRKGVKVGEFGERSLFHYNLPNIPVKESRIVDSYEAEGHCAIALSRSLQENIEIYLNRVVCDANPNLWEAEFSAYNLNPENQYFKVDGHKERTIEKWKDAAKTVLGNKMVCESNFIRDVVHSKGRETFVPDPKFIGLLKIANAKMSSDVLNKNELEGKIIKEPTENVLKKLDEVWNRLVKLEMTLEKSKPSVQCYEQHSTSEGSSFGYCDNGVVYIRTDISEDDGLFLFQTILEELAHYITGAMDCTRDFQEFTLKCASRALLGVKE